MLGRSPRRTAGLKAAPLRSAPQNFFISLPGVLFSVRKAGTSTPGGTSRDAWTQRAAADGVKRRRLEAFVVRVTGKVLSHNVAAYAQHFPASSTFGESLVQAEQEELKSCEILRTRT